MGKQIWIILIISTFLLSGCWDFKQIEKQLYFNSLGIDYVDHKFVMYGQVISFENIAKQEGVSQRTPPLIDIVKGQGETIDDAGFDLYPASPQRISWDHVSAIVYSKRLLNSDMLNEVNDFLSRFLQIRDTVWVFGTELPIEDILFSTPILKTSPLFSQLNSPDDITKQLSRYKPIKLFELDALNFEPATKMELPFLSITKQRWKEQKKRHPSLIINEMGFENNKGKFVSMPIDDMHGYQYFNDRDFRNKLKLKKNGKPISVGSIIHIKSKITPVTLKPGKIQVNLKVKMDYQIIQLNEDIGNRQLEKLSQRVITNQIKNVLKKSIENDIDLLGISDSIYRQDPKFWKKENKDGMIPLDQVEIKKMDIHCHILNTSELKKRTFESKLHK
ncbi:Ger(x)C family spore germination protein [Neobacillus vireti]|uniref:Ger(x)C family spore germination protein n=1 Tax=Neobacillus vireti TaxID=220686 RepID=UPI003000B81D